ncbi:MAG: IS110 family transposase [Burkholderiales bacterium]
MKITTIGLDLAKSVFQVHAVDAGGRVVLRKQVKRAQMKAFFAKLPPCLVGMEACGGAHYWGRELQALGHVVKLMPPQYVKPFVKRNKNDAADAEAICEAVQRPNMHFVPIKTVEQQAILAVHRVRQGLVKARTAQANQIRGLLAEFGLAIPKGIAQIEPRVLALLEDGNNGLPDSFRRLLEQLRQRLGALGRQQAELEVQIKDWHTQHEDSRRLATIPGVGPLSASALVASVGPARTYKNGRQLSACLGIVPRQASSGGKTTLLGISKRGDSYLRTLLIHGARAVVRQAQRAPEKAEPWLRELLRRRPTNVATVALANRNARVAWALLAHQHDYRQPLTK